MIVTGLSNGYLVLGRTPVGGGLLNASHMVSTRLPDSGLIIDTSFRSPSLNDHRLMRLASLLDADLSPRSGYLHGYFTVRTLQLPNEHLVVDPFHDHLRAVINTWGAVRSLDEQ